MTAPQVELLVRDLSPDALDVVEGRRLGSLDEALSAALMSYRMMMVTHAKARVTQLPEVTGDKLLNILDMAAQLYLPRYYKIIGPHTAAAYLSAYHRVQAGDVPVEVIYALAQQHAERTGTYFNQTSREAIERGFNAYVNRKVPAKAAAERVLDAYGLTPRQMNGMVALTPDAQILSAQPRDLKARITEYIGKSLRSRLRTFTKQEAHNIDSQAEQTAWLWLQQVGRISPAAQKVWITARDERTCAQCAPMHNVRVGVGEQFTLPNRTKLYVPGAHVNCRCVARLLDTVSPVSKAEAWDPREHPRGGDPENRGRFSVKARTKPVKSVDPEALKAFQAFLDTALEAEEIEHPMEERRPLESAITRQLESAQTAKPQQLHSAAPLRSAAILPTPLFESDVTPPVLESVKAGIRGLESVGVRPQPKPSGHPAPEAKVQKLSPDGRPFYSVVSPTDPEPPHDWDFYLNERHFHDNLEDAKQEVANIREAVVQDLFNDLAGHDGYVTKPIVHPEHPEYHGYVNNDDLWNALRLLQTSPGDWASTAEVQWLDARGLPETELRPEVSLLEITQQLNVGPDDVNVWILRTTHGHLGEDTLVIGGGAVQLSGKFVVADAHGSVPDAEFVDTEVREVKPYV